MVNIIQLVLRKETERKREEKTEGGRNERERKEEGRPGTINSVTIGGRACRGRTGRKILTLELVLSLLCSLIPLNKYYLEGAVKKRQKSSFKIHKSGKESRWQNRRTWNLFLPLKYIKNTSIHGTTAEGEILQNSF